MLKIVMLETKCYCRAAVAFIIVRVLLFICLSTFGTYSGFAQTKDDHKISSYLVTIEQDTIFLAEEMLLELGEKEVSFVSAAGTESVIKRDELSQVFIEGEIFYELLSRSKNGKSPVIQVVILRTEKYKLTMYTGGGYRSLQIYTTDNEILETLGYGPSRFSKNACPILQEYFGQCTEFQDEVLSKCSETKSIIEEMNEVYLGICK